MTIVTVLMVVVFKLNFFCGTTPKVAAVLLSLREFIPIHGVYLIFPPDQSNPIHCV